MDNAAVASKGVNQLLDSLGDEVRQRLTRELTEVELPLGKVLQRPGERPEYVYFPRTGVCSFTLTMNDGRIVEVGTVGCEGFVGVWAYLGPAVFEATTVVQVPGNGLALRTAAFMAELDRRGEFFDRVRRYGFAFVSLLMQSIACNALHDIPQRAARWLLMCADRAGGPAFDLTQEHLAAMLGVRRPTVTLVMRDLQAAGLVQYRRRRIEILDRERLALETCECYGAVRKHFDAILPEGATSQ